eukprot:6198969-Pleurochrysis_carterae.AAC.1
MPRMLLLSRAVLLILSIAAADSPSRSSPYTLVSSSASKPVRVRSAQVSLPWGFWSRFFDVSADLQPCPYFFKVSLSDFLTAKLTLLTVMAMERPVELILWCKSEGALAMWSCGWTGTPSRDSPACVFMCARSTAGSFDGGVSSMRARSIA